jgi:glutamate/tyrosine decarboxylase-like PLP-dependent enzyme
MRPAYLSDQMDPKEERYDYFVHGFEQSRRFRALKVWMGFMRYGAKQIGRWVDANVAHAERLYELAEAHPVFRVARKPEMSAICIRYAPDGMPEDRAARLHAEVARRVEESGRFWISTTVLKGQTYFRVNPVNFRTRREDIEELFALLERECERARDSRD